MCKTLAERIQKLMDERGLTQADLARLTGMTTSNIAYLVNGKTQDPRMMTLIAVAQALGVSLDYLTGYKVSYHVISLEDKDGE